MVFKPIIVDLDGTLIYSDMLYESALGTLRDKPYLLFCLPYWLLKGKALLKARLAASYQFKVKNLPYNLDLIAWLKEKKLKGHKLILCTGSHFSIANTIAGYLGIFDEIMASSKDINLTGQNKADALVQRFGFKGFDYIGNSIADLKVWEKADQVISITSSSQLLNKIKNISSKSKNFAQEKISIMNFCQILRVHQWLKNLLLFVPIFAAHQFNNFYIWKDLILGCFSFSLCTSAIYILNDLLDLDNDRSHPRKKNRLFAAGKVSISIGLILIPCLLTFSYLLTYLLDKAFLYWLIIYFLLACLYSWQLKSKPLIDCLTLASLYTLRITAGSVVAGLTLSFWLLAFSFFLFLSLAYVKRYTEMQVNYIDNKEKLPGRNYYLNEANLIQNLGVSSGYASIVVLALYLNSEAVIKLYHMPELIWATVPIMLFWVSWIWLQAQRRQMNDDPLLFALKDKISLITGFVLVIIVIMGNIGGIFL